MNTIKRVAIGCTALLLTVGLTACFQKDEPDPSTEPSVSQTTTSTTTMTTTTTQAAMTPQIGWVNATSLHVRPNASQKDDAIGGLEQEDQVTIIGEEGDWYRIQFKPDTVGYVNKAYIVFDKADITNSGQGGTTTSSGTSTSSPSSTTGTTAA